MAVGLAVAVLASPGLGQDEAAPDSEEASEPMPIFVDGDRVTATFTGATPESVVRDIAGAMSAEVIGAPQGTDAITVDLDDVPLDRALERALGNQSFTIVYGGDGGVRRIRLHGGPQDASGSGAGAVRKAPTSAGVRILPHQLFEAEVRVPTVGPLAEHLGSETATLGQLYRIAIDSEEAALRIAAVDAGMAAIESDQDLQGGVDGLLDTTDDATLVALVRSGAGQRANEFVSRILSRTRRPAVRQRAVTLLRQLRQPAS